MLVKVNPIRIGVPISLVVIVNQSTEKVITVFNEFCIERIVVIIRGNCHPSVAGGKLIGSVVLGIHFLDKTTLCCVNIKLSAQFVCFVNNSLYAVETCENSIYFFYILVYGNHFSTVNGEIVYMILSNCESCGKIIETFLNISVSVVKRSHRCRNVFGIELKFTEIPVRIA